MFTMIGVLRRHHPRDVVGTIEAGGRPHPLRRQCTTITGGSSAAPRTRAAPHRAEALPPWTSWQEVSQGRLEWMRGNKKESAREMRWGAFDKLFWEKGRHVRTRTGRRRVI